MTCITGYSVVRETIELRSFSMYEFVAVIVPGAILVLGLWFVPQLRDLLSGEQDTSGLTATAVYLLLSYAAGHVAQAGGNLIEAAYWKMWGGPPIDWVRSECRYLISSQQKTAVENAIRYLIPNRSAGLKGVSKNDWQALKRELNVMLSERGFLEYQDLMNANYHLCRALPVSCIALGFAMGFASVLTCAQGMLLGSICIAVVAASLWRMHRYGEHAAREFYIKLIRMHAINCAQSASSSE